VLAARLCAVFGVARAALEVAGIGLFGGTRPGGHGPAGCRLRAMLRNRSASGQAAAKAMRTREEVSVTRAAILSSRTRNVANSACASDWGFGIVSRTASNNQ
jgi:hypothetical protein